MIVSPKLECPLVQLEMTELAQNLGWVDLFLLVLSVVIISQDDLLLAC